MDSSEYMANSPTPHQSQPLAQRSPKRKFEEFEKASTIVAISRADQPEIETHTQRNLLDEDMSPQTTTRWICLALKTTLGALAIHTYHAVCSSLKKSVHHTKAFLARHIVVEIRSRAEDGHESVKRRAIEHVRGAQPPVDRKIHPASRSPPHMTTIATTSHSHPQTHMEQIAHAFANNSGRQWHNNATADIFNVYPNTFQPSTSHPHSHGVYKQTPAVDSRRTELGRHETAILDAVHISHLGTTMTGSDSGSNDDFDMELGDELREVVVNSEEAHMAPCTTAAKEAILIHDERFNASSEAFTDRELLRTSEEQPVVTRVEPTRSPVKHRCMPGDIFAFEDESNDDETTHEELHDHNYTVHSNDNSKNFEESPVRNVLNYSESVMSRPEVDESIWIPNDFPQPTYTDTDLNNFSSCTSGITSAPINLQNNTLHGHPTERISYDHLTEKPTSTTRKETATAHIQQLSRKAHQLKITPTRNLRHRKYNKEQKDEFSPLRIEDRTFDGPAYSVRPPRLRGHRTVNPLQQQVYFTEISTPQARRAVFRNGRSPANKPVKHAHFSNIPGGDMLTVSTRIFDDTNRPELYQLLENRHIPQTLEHTQYDTCLTDIPQIMQNGEPHKRSPSQIQINGVTNNATNEVDAESRSNAEAPGTTIAPAIRDTAQSTDYIVSETYDVSLEMTDAPDISTAQPSLPSAVPLQASSQSISTRSILEEQVPSTDLRQSPTTQLISEVEYASTIPLPPTPKPSDSAQIVSGAQDGPQPPHTPTRSASNESLNEAVNTLSISRDRSRQRKEKEEAKRRREEAKRAAKEAAAAEAKRIAEEEAVKAAGTRRMPSVPLIQPISADWETRLKTEMQKSPNTVIAKSITGTDLTSRDFATVLGQTSWLNDEIINAYLDAIVDYSNNRTGSTSRGTTPKYLAHNSFFYKTLAAPGGLTKVSRWMKRKKAEGTKLLNVEQIFIPVNNAAHWTIIIVSPTRRTIEYLDSFGGPAHVFVSNIKKWLAQELGSAWKPEEWRVLDTKSAIQTNGYDCGVFAITNAKCVALGLDPTCYSGRDLAMQRRRVAAELIAGGFVGEFTPPSDL